MVNSDRNQTDLHRFKPNSRAILKNEQFNFLNQIQLKVMTNRHRGHKRKRSYERLVFIILLSLRYFLFDNQKFKHSNYLVQ